MCQPPWWGLFLQMTPLGAACPVLGATLLPLCVQGCLSSTAPPNGLEDTLRGSHWKVILRHRPKPGWPTQHLQLCERGLPSLGLLTARRLERSQKAGS